MKRYLCLRKLSKRLGFVLRKTLPLRLRCFLLSALLLLSSAFVSLFISSPVSAASATPVSTDLYYYWRNETVVSHKHNPIGNILDVPAYMIGWIETINLPYSPSGKVGFSFDFDITFRSVLESGTSGWTFKNTYPCSLSSNMSGLSFAISECNSWSGRDSTYQIYHFTGKAVVSNASGLISGTPQLTFYLGNSNVPRANYIMFSTGQNFMTSKPLQYNNTVITNFETYTDPNTAILNQQMQVMQDTNQRLESISQQLNDRIYELQNQNQNIINGITQGNDQAHKDSQAEIDAINKGNQAEQDRYDKDKEEESDRENQGKDDADTAQGIFSFTFLNPFIGIFELFNNGGCVSIPTIAEMVGSEETQYCPWFSSSTRNILTPVLGIASMMLLFGFVVGWLNGRDLNGTIFIKGGK